MKRGYVLLSGGVDSTTCLYAAHAQCDEVHALSVDYGQRHLREVRYARESCDRLGVRHRVLDLREVVPRTTLTDTARDIPNVSYADIRGVSPTYVPFRNGVLLSTVASLVHGEYITHYGSVDQHVEMGVEWFIYFGAHAEDAAGWAYPDCTPEFIGSVANAIYVGTYRAVRLCTPLEWMVKSDIIRLGERLGVDWSLTWSCYRGEEVHCGTCPTCRARREGFRAACVRDPTEYARAA